METTTGRDYDTQLSQRYQTLIWFCLDCDLARTAVFYAERYFSIHQIHASRHLYALSLLRLGQTYPALALVTMPEAKTCSGCLELKAKCCTALGRFRQAAEALNDAMQHSSYNANASNADRPARQFPDTGAMYCRMGKMALKGNLHDMAADSFQKALSHNPLLWEAFEGLCSLGLVPEIDKLFPPRPPPVRRPEDKPSFPVATGAAFFTPDVNGAHGGNLFRPWDSSAQSRMGPPAIPESLTSQSPYPLDSQTRPSRVQASFVMPTQPNFSRPLSSAEESGPVAKKMRSNRQPEMAKPTKAVKQNGDDAKKPHDRFQLSNLFSSSNRRTQPPRPGPSTKTGTNLTAASATTRRSTRLTTGTAAKPGTKATRDRRRQASQTQAQVRSSLDSDTEEDAYGAEATYSPSPPPNAQSPRSDRSLSPGSWTASAQEIYEGELADNHIYNTMRRFAVATRALALYDLKGCIESIHIMPDDERKTPWSLSLLGRAHFEKADYKRAEQTYHALRISDPYRLWDMDVYSTLLWYLQKHVQLSFLAQELLNINPRSPEAWIAIGNLFSLQKERTQALTCFARAAQMDPSCAYAYTLSGHESIDDDLAKAINFFQCALRVDPRHYNAWYGLGSCYMRSSRLRLAEYHYRKASSINPKNAVLLGCVGMALERKGDRSGAIAIFDEAIDIAADNALVRYRRAKILLSLKKYDDAIFDLEYLRKTAPEEANVVFQLAKAYRLIGDEVKAAQLLAAVRDIAPKNLHRIKRLLDTVRDEGATVADEMDTQ